MRIKGSQSSTLKLVGGGMNASGGVLDIFGPLRAGLITLQTTQNQPPLESPSDWERSPRIPESRSSKGSVISSTDTTLRVVRGLTGSSDTTTDVIH